jgi:hypothetical protein
VGFQAVANVTENHGGRALVKDRLLGSNRWHLLSALGGKRLKGNRRENESEKQEQDENSSASGHVAIS